MQSPNFVIEKNLAEQLNLKHIAGVDEVGRGCLAGPIVAADVIFGKHVVRGDAMKAIADSKKLTSKKRKELDLWIRENCFDFAVGEVDSEEIDQYGIGAANVIAFSRALNGLQSCDFAIIDGRKFRGLDFQFACFEKGESKSISIAAASIVAKVYRDNLMRDNNLVYPEYGFDKHKGYGSELHYEKLLRFGPSQIHRKTFLKSIEPKQDTLFWNTKLQITNVE